MFAGFYRSGCLLHSLAEMEAARLGTPYQGIIYHAALKIIKTFYKINQTSGEPHLPRHLHPGHHLHYCGPHDNHTRRDRCGLPTRALDDKNHFNFSHRPGDHRHGGPRVFPLHLLAEQTCCAPDTQRLRHFSPPETSGRRPAQQERLKAGWSSPGR